LKGDAARLDNLAKQAGWHLVGGTPLFRTYNTPNARAAQTHLARHHVWSRNFPYSETWIRLGLPGTEAGWAQLEKAINDT
jgi:cobalamin biosynthetic protein CobC